MEKKTDKNNNNGENYYFHILTRGIIIDGDYILVAKAKNANNTFLPGGHLEFNENLKKSLEREIMEEISINCNIGEYIGCVEAKWVENNNINQKINHIFIVNGINKKIEIKSKENHLELYWIKINDVEKENLLSHSIRALIHNIHNNKKEANYFSEI